LLFSMYVYVYSSASSSSKERVNTSSWPPTYRSCRAEHRQQQQCR
jgi:hypothetical protein